ncbi:MAG: histidine kinase [Rhizorhabdus sp.]|nr:histidine kinase [Rhizorhabdus sp.]
MAAPVIYPAGNLDDARILAQAIVNTIPEPFLVLDARFRVLAASRSFYETFAVDPDKVQGRLLYDLGDGQWDIPALRLLLETIIPDQVVMKDFEVEADFPVLGRRTMLLSGRKVLYDDSADITILLAFQDVTARRIIEQEKQELLLRTEELLRQKQVLFQEMQHRVANSLQIIASILMLKARAVSSEETRFHLEAAHQRVLSVAAVQQHLHATDGVDKINVRHYLTKLCSALAESMVEDSRPIGVSVEADGGMIESSEAVSLGLIVTELVINAIKYAFPALKADASILVTYASDAPMWTLAVSDNGIGLDPGQPPRTGGGLGTTIVHALAKQLGADMRSNSAAGGLQVSVTKDR